MNYNAFPRQRKYFAGGLLICRHAQRRVDSRGCRLPSKHLCRNFPSGR